MQRWFRPWTWYTAGLALITWSVALPRDRSPEHFGWFTRGAAILLAIGSLFLFLGLSMAKLERAARRDE